jgi:hypothetical protein
MTSQSKPNIVLILVDNVGWGDWGIYGGTTSTPRIRKLKRALTKSFQLNASASAQIDYGTVCGA